MRTYGEGEPRSNLIVPFAGFGSDKSHATVDNLPIVSVGLASRPGKALKVSVLEAEPLLS